MIHDKMHYTGCYVICNFGPYENMDEAPVYLVDPTRGCTPYTFTANLCKAQMFANKWTAEEELKRENKHLEAVKHPLAGHLFIADVLTYPIIPLKED